MNAQEQVYNAVAERGYLDSAKWTREQLIVRQVVKLIEELGEAAGNVEVSPPFSRSKVTPPQQALNKMMALGREAKDSFNGQSFDGSYLLPSFLAAELADLQVVLFTVAELLGVDVVQMALDKAAADVARGVLP